MSSYNDFRAFLKPNGSNPEIDSSYYELASHKKIEGLWNCEVLTLGFQTGDFYSQLYFRPIDPTKAIVFAIDDVNDGCYFVVVDGHIDAEMKKSKGSMFNHQPFKTDDYLIDCNDGSGIGQKDYWSITSKGMTFVYGDIAFPDTWHLTDCDLLCAFVGGGLTANQLRMRAYLTNREAVKEERREVHIQRLTSELREITDHSDAARLVLICTVYQYNRLVSELNLAMNGVLPFVGKTKISKVIEENKLTTL